MKIPALLLVSFAVPAAAQTTLSGLVRNTSGERIAGLTIHFYKHTGEGFEHLSVTTAANGTWSIALPAGEWRGAARTDDLLTRGYFCAPGFIWCPEECSGGDWPDLWGGGLIEWEPIELPGLIDVTVVPTRPDLSVEKPRTAAAGVKVSFETTDAAMSVTRQWRIEKSSDLRNWQPLQTVALSGSSPVIVPDPESAQAPVCYYRAVQVEDIVTAAE